MDVTFGFQIKSEDGETLLTSDPTWGDADDAMVECRRVLDALQIPAPRHFSVIAVVELTEPEDADYDVGSVLDLMEALNVDPERVRSAYEARRAFNRLKDPSETSPESR